MSFTPLKRGTVLIPSGTLYDPDKRHLFVICSDTDDEGNCVIVPFCSVTNSLCDQTCVVQPHEHPFFKHVSYVKYQKAEIQAARALVNGVEQNIFIPKEDLNAQTFLKVAKGFCVSKETPRKVKIYLGCPVTARV